MDNQQGHGTWNSVQCYVAAWMRGEFREECIHVYVRQNAFWGSPENITTLLMRYSPIQTKKLKGNEYIINTCMN